MPRLARHRVTGKWWNDFSRGERKPGRVLSEVAKRADPADYEEVVVTLAEYDVIEAAYFRERRIAAAAQQKIDDADWESAKGKLKFMALTVGQLTEAEIAQYSSRVLGE